MELVFYDFYEYLYQVVKNMPSAVAEAKAATMATPYTCGGSIPPLGSIVAAACFRNVGCYPTRRELGGLCWALYATRMRRAVEPSRQICIEAREAKRMELCTHQRLFKPDVTCGW